MAVAAGAALSVVVTVVALECLGRESPVLEVVVLHTLNVLINRAVVPNAAVRGIEPLFSSRCKEVARAKVK